MKKVAYILIGIFLIGLAYASFPGMVNSETMEIIVASNAPTLNGGGVEYKIILSCEDYCEDSAPFTTFCNEEDECEVVESSRDYYMKSLDGQCQKYFDQDNKEECYNWWNHHYEERANRYFIIIIALLIFIAISLVYKKKERKENYIKN